MKKNSLNLAFASSLLLCSSFVTPATASDLDEALLTDKTIHPATQSLLTEVLEDSWKKSKTTIKDKVITSIRLGKNIYSGDYSELVSEGINYLFASLAGQKDVVLFGGSNPEFHENSLNACADKFVEFFMDHTMKMLNQRGDLYGIDSQGGRVKIFQNRTFSRFILENLLPENLPLRGAILGICNNDIVEKAIHRQLRAVALNYLKNLAAHRDSTLKEISGQFVATNLPKAAKLTYEFMTAESDPIDLEPVWKFIGPYMTHALRQFTHFALTKSMEAIGKQLDVNVKGLAINGARVVGAGTTYAFGKALEFTGSFVPYIGVPISYTGSMMSSTYAPIAGGYLGGFFGSSLFEATGKNVAKRLPGYLDFLNYQIFGYSEEEHRLFNLNPNPSDIERALFLEDYEAREKLQRSYAIMEIIRYLATMDGTKLAQSIYNSLGTVYEGCLQTLWDLFKKDPGITDEQALEATKLDKFINHDKKRHKESSESAYRRLLVISETNPAEAEKINEMIRQHPSFGLQMKKFESFLQKESLELNKKSTNSKAKALMLNQMAEEFGYWLNIDGKTGFANQEPARQILLNLSISEQDILCDVIERRHADHDYDNLLADLGDKTPEDAEKIIKSLIEKIAAKQDRLYREANAEGIEALSQTSLADGLSMVDLVTLHKALNTDEQLGILEELVQLTQQEGVQYSSDELETLKGYYITATGFQRGKLLSDILKANLIEKGAIKTVKDDLIKRLDSSTEVADIKLAIQSELEENAIYTSLMKAIRPIRNDDSVLFTNEVKEIFNQRRENLFTDLANSIKCSLEEKLKRKQEALNVDELEMDDWVDVKATVQDESQNVVDTDWHDVSLSGSLVIANQDLLLEKPSVKSVVALMKQDETKLKTFDHDVTGVGLFIFAQHLNKQSFDEPFFLNDKHLKELHEAIWKNKEKAFTEKASDSDLEFYNKYKREIHNFRQKSPKFKGRSFYGLKELLREFREYNDQLLRVVL